ncbi:hypothetical protein K2Z83_15630 [Oscillochloris sp. ZM17-4]|uniref:hypothetical protein n=1 Tax=Oscillochloris sp. ZM17-4 TaxID=2866714 RepID=UPI001C7382A0|nr:hypothetical protein [Oscillochloris sp. ZM17-4]MBX0329108.1 hypothetical protein [Oscillochloris sp. ZM17-4]
MSALTFENLLRHISHTIVCRAHGTPPQNVVIHCATCDEVIIDLDADGESLFGLVPLKPEPPVMPPAVAAVPVAAD